MGVSMKSHKIIDQVLNQVRSTADVLAMPLLTCTVHQRRPNTKGAKVLSLNWISTAFFDKDGSLQGVVFQLQAFPLLGVTTTWSDESQDFIVVQQNQLTGGIFQQ